MFQKMIYFISSICGYYTKSRTKLQKILLTTKFSYSFAQFITIFSPICRHFPSVPALKCGFIIVSFIFFR